MEFYVQPATIGRGLNELQLENDQSLFEYLDLAIQKLLIFKEGLYESK